MANIEVSELNDGPFELDDWSLVPLDTTAIEGEEELHDGVNCVGPTSIGRPNGPLLAEPTKVGEEPFGVELEIACDWGVLAVELANAVPLMSKIAITMNVANESLVNFMFSSVILKGDLFKGW